MTEDTLERLRGLLSSETAVRRERIHPETLLGEDLGIDGDDAVELFERSFDEFGVSREGFRMDDYFGSEAAANMIASIWYSLFSREPIKKTLTVRDLVMAVERKQWTSSDAVPVP